MGPGTWKQVCDEWRIVNGNGRHQMAMGDREVGTQWEDLTVCTRQIEKGLNKLFGF